MPYDAQMTTDGCLIEAFGIWLPPLHHITRPHFFSLTFVPSSTSHAFLSTRLDHTNCLTTCHLFAPVPTFSSGLVGARTGEGRIMRAEGCLLMFRLVSFLTAEMLLLLCVVAARPVSCRVTALQGFRSADFASPELFLLVRNRLQVPKK